MMWGYGFHPMGWIFGALLIALVVSRIFFFRRYGHGCHGGYHHGQDDAMAILRRRLVNGEISDEEYRRLKEILSK